MVNDSETPCGNPVTKCFKRLSVDTVLYVPLCDEHVDKFLEIEEDYIGSGWEECPKEEAICDSVLTN